MADPRKVRLDHNKILSKAISAGHATATSVAAILLLTHSSWHIRKEVASASARENYGQQPGQLDDQRNPIIQGQSPLANALTAWETVYLLYDTYSMISTTRRRDNLRTNLAAVHLVAKESPVALAHHVLLASAFLVLQSYILAGKERGLWVITAFMLMNSSTPLMHARWWFRQRTGKSSNTLDAAFLAAFAGARFGVVVWVLQKYGKHHGMGAMQAYKLLRRKCQVGTAMLVALNGAWWIILAANILKRNLRRPTRWNSPNLSHSSYGPWRASMVAA